MLTNCCGRRDSKGLASKKRVHTAVNHDGQVADNLLEDSACL